MVASDAENGPGHDAFVHWDVTDSDTYFVRARSEAGPATGTYQLGIILQNAGPAPDTSGVINPTMEPNDGLGTADDVSTSWRQVGFRSQTTGNIAAGDADVFRYQLTAGDLVTVDVASLGLNAQVTLRSSTGTPIASNNGDGTDNDASLIAFNIPTTGDYYVEVRRATGASTGAYSLDVYLTTNTTPPTATDQDFFNIGQMQAGDVITITMSGLDSNRGTLPDPTLAIFSANQQVQFDDNSGPGSDSIVYRYTVPTTNTNNFYIRASSLSGLFGSYQIGVSLENANAPPNVGGPDVVEAESNNSITLAQNVSTAWHRPSTARRRAATSAVRATWIATRSRSTRATSLDQHGRRPRGACRPGEHGHGPDRSFGERRDSPERLADLRLAHSLDRQLPSGRAVGQRIDRRVYRDRRSDRHPAAGATRQSAHRNRTERYQPRTRTMPR